MPQAAPKSGQILRPEEKRKSSSDQSKAKATAGKSTEERNIAEPSAAKESDQGTILISEQIATAISMEPYLLYVLEKKTGLDLRRY